MGTPANRIFMYQLLFAACIAIPYLNNYELTFAVWSVAALVTISTKYSIGIFKQLCCYAAILSIAIVVYFFRDYELYFVIRDTTYLLKPVLGLLIGYQLVKKIYGSAFETLVYTGFLIAVIHILILLFAVVYHGATTLNDLRFYGGYFSDFEVYALIILLFHERFELTISRKRLQIITLVIGFSAFMYLARTNFIQFILLALAMKGLMRINKTSVMVFTTVVTLVAISYSAILYVNPKRNGEGIEALLYKIKIAPIEAFKTRINREDWKDFNDNYRSWENIMTVRQMTNDGVVPIIFGKGIGSQVDLKQKVWLGDMELRYISFLHNGFMTVFLKAGLLGVFLSLLSIYLLLKQRRSEVPIVQSINLLLIGTGVFLIFSNWVFMGLYNLLDSKSILIGFLLCYKAIRTKTIQPPQSL